MIYIHFDDFEFIIFIDILNKLQNGTLFIIQKFHETELFEKQNIFLRKKEIIFFMVLLKQKVENINII
jgi:hypothetical protein